MAPNPPPPPLPDGGIKGDTLLNGKVKLFTTLEGELTSFNRSRFKQGISAAAETPLSWISILSVRVGSVTVESQIDVPASDGRMPEDIADQIMRVMRDDMARFEELIGAKVVPGMTSVTYENVEQDAGPSTRDDGGGGNGGDNGGGGRNDGDGNPSPNAGTELVDDGAVSLALVIGVSIAAACVVLALLAVLARLVRNERARKAAAAAESEAADSAARRARARSRSRSPHEQQDVSISLDAQPLPRNATKNNSEPRGRGLSSVFRGLQKPRPPPTAEERRA